MAKKNKKPTVEVVFNETENSLIIQNLKTNSDLKIEKDQLQTFLTLIKDFRKHGSRDITK